MLFPSCRPLATRNDKFRIDDKWIFLALSADVAFGVRLEGSDEIFSWFCTRNKLVTINCSSVLFSIYLLRGGIYQSRHVAIRNLSHRSVANWSIFSIQRSWAICDFRVIRLSSLFVSRYVSHWWLPRIVRMCGDVLGENGKWKKSW